MAEKEKEIFNQDLVCPLCLDILDDATLLSCEHTFCRKCLMKCVARHTNRDDLICPLCRNITKLPHNKVDGLASNVFMNEQVDEYIVTIGGMMGLLHIKQTCTSCNEKTLALSFCRDCDVFMCEQCHTGHKKLRFLFEKHRVVSIHETEEVAYGQCDRCEVHQPEKKDLFCETCSIHVCLKCVVVNHRDHQIKNQKDFEKDIRRKMNEISQGCDQENHRIKKNIQYIEKVRQDVQNIISGVESIITQEHENKMRCLVEHQTMLVESVRSLQTGFIKDLDQLKTNQRQRAKTMSSSLSLVITDRLKCLEGDSLSAHTLMCRDLEKLLKDTNDTTALADRVRQSAKRVQFHPADEKPLKLGHLEVGLKIVRELLVHDIHDIWGMAKLSQDAVVVVGGGFGPKGSRSYSLSGEEQIHLGSSIGSVHDIAFLTDGRPIVSRDLTTCCVFSNHDTTSFKYKCHKGEWDLRLCSDQHDNIYAVNMNPEIYVFHGSNPNPQRVIPTGGIKPIQICVTKTGALIASTCITTPSTVSVFNREGHCGSTMKGSNDSEYLYAAVDSNDRVLVARVYRGSDILRLVRYTLKGLQLIEQTTFKELKLPHKIKHSPYWCYMILLTPKILAFATLGKHLYFIEFDA